MPKLIVRCLVGTINFPLQKRSITFPNVNYTTGNDRLYSIQRKITFMLCSLYHTTCTFKRSQTVHGKFLSINGILLYSHVYNAKYLFKARS